MTDTTTAVVPAADPLDDPTKRAEYVAKLVEYLAGRPPYLVAASYCALFRQTGRFAKLHGETCRFCAIKRVDVLAEAVTKTPTTGPDFRSWEGLERSDPKRARAYVKAAQGQDDEGGKS